MDAVVILTGVYHTVCAILNAFEIPAPSRHLLHSAGARRVEGAVVDVGAA